MEIPLLFDVAGIPVLLEGSATLASRYAHYRATLPRPPTVRIRVVAPGALPIDRAVHWGDSWLATDGNELVLGEGNEHTADRLLLHAFAGILAEHGTVLAHASSVDGPRGAVAFLGPSGVGKTTAARNCPAPMIHPDRAALGWGSSSPWLAPVPFLYPVPVDGRVHRRPLAALVFVQQSSVNRVNALSPPDARRRVLTSVLMPAEPRLGQAVLDSVLNLTSRVPVLELEARLEGGFWPLIAGVESFATPQEGR